MAIFFLLQETIIGTWTAERVRAGAVWKDSGYKKKYWHVDYWNTTRINISNYLKFRNSKVSI